MVDERNRKQGLRQREADELRLDEKILRDELQRRPLTLREPAQLQSEQPQQQSRPLDFRSPTRPRDNPDEPVLDFQSPVTDVEQAGFNQVNRERNTFQQGLAQGIENLRATVPATLSIAGGLVGAEDFAVRQAERAQQISELGQKLGPQTSFQGVLDGEVGFGDFLAGLAGTQAPNLASIALSGGVAGLTGKALGKAAVSGVVRDTTEALAKRQAAREAQLSALGKIGSSRRRAGAASRAAPGLNATKQEIQQEARTLKSVLERQRKFTYRGADVGTALGAGSSIAASVAPETTDIILDEDAGSIQQRAAAAAVGAGSAAVINTLPVMRLFRKMGLGKTTERAARQIAKRRGLLRNVGGEGVTQAVFEGGTEVAEGIIISAAHKYLNENVEIFSDEAIAGMIEEFAAGAILGAGGGVVSGTAITMRQPGPIEAETERRNAERQLAAKKNGVKYLSPEEQARRNQPASDRVDQATDGFVGGIVLDSIDPGVNKPEFQVAQEVGEAFRVLIDPDANADALVADEQGNEITAADAATRLLEERFGVDVAGTIGLAREAFAQGVQFDIDRLAAALDEQAAIDEIQDTVPEGVPGSEEFRLNRQVLNQELAFRREQLDEIINNGVPTVEETLDPDTVLERQQRRDEGEIDAEQEGVDMRGDALQEIPARARPVLNEEQGNTPPVALKSGQGLKGSSILGRVFVGERTPEAGKSETARTGAQRIVEQLNNETGSNGRFDVAPAGDTLVRELNSRAGRDDSETAANSPEVQQGVVTEARKVAIAGTNITEGNALFTTEGTNLSGVAKQIAAIDKQLDPKAKKKLSDEKRAELEQQKAELEPLLQQPIDPRAALQFLNQFDTVIEEQQAAALTGADPLALTPDQLRTAGIVESIPRDRPLEPNEILVRNPNGEQQVVNLVALTQQLIGRVQGEGGFESRGGTKEQKKARGQDFEQQGGSGISPENIGRAVASGLAEVLTRNGFVLGPDQQVLDATYQRLTEVQGEIENLRAAEQPIPQELVNEVAELEGAIATELRETVDSVLRDNAVAFRTRGGVETTVGGSGLRGEAAIRAEIENATRVADVQKRVDSLTATRNKIRQGTQKERREKLTALIKKGNLKIRELRGAKQIKADVDSGKIKFTKGRAKQLQQRIDKLREAYGLKGKKALKRAVREAMGFPSLNGIRTERLSILSTADPSAAPTLPVVEGNEENIAKDQAKADKAAELAKAKGGTAKFIGRGTVRSSTNLYSVVYGPRANSGVYNANDAVFLSVEGNRGGSKGFEASREEVKRAIDAGADIITDGASREGNAQQNARRKKRLAKITAEVKEVRTELGKSSLVAELTRKAIKETLTSAEASEAANPNVATQTQIADVNRQITELLDARTSAELDAKLLVNMPDLTVAARRKQMKGIVDKLAEIDSAMQTALDERAQLTDQLVRAGTPGPAAAALRRARAQLNRLERTNKVLAQRLEALAKEQAAAEADVDYNTGERAAANYLREQGYVENEQGGLSVWSRRRNDVPAPINDEPVQTQAEPEAAAQPEISDKEFSEFRNVPETLSAAKIEALLKARAESALRGSPDGRFTNSTMEKMAQQLIREQKVSAKQAIKTVNEIFDLVDEFVAAFGTTHPNVQLAMKVASNGGTYIAETNTVVLNVNNLGKSGLTPKNRQTIIHELSHALEFDALLNASKEEQAALIKEYNAWRKQAKARIDAAKTEAAKVQVLEALISEKRGQATGVSADLEKAEAYVLSPREWFADNAARLIIEGTTNGIKDPLALSVLKRLAEKLKEMFDVFAKRTPSAPELRKFLINMRNAANPELEAETGAQDFAVPKKELTEAEQRRLKRLEAAEQRMQERLLELEQLQQLVDETSVGDSIKVLEAQIRMLQMLEQERKAHRGEQEAKARTREQRHAEIWREDERRRRIDEQAGDSVVDNNADDTRPERDFIADPPPWLDTQDARDRFNPPSLQEIINEQNRLKQDLQDAGVENLDVEIIDWADAIEVFDSALAKGKTLENIESMSVVKDGKVVVWVNETIHTDGSSRRAALNNEIARGALLHRAGQLTNDQAQVVLKALGFKGSKSQLMKILNMREGGLGALKPQNRGQLRRMVSRLTNKMRKPGGNAFFKDVRKITQGLLRATDSTISVADLIKDIPRVTGRVSSTQRFSTMWAETKRKAKVLNPQANVNKAVAEALRGESRPANKKKDPPAPPSKPAPPSEPPSTPPQDGAGGSGGDGGRGGPPQAPASPDDAFGAYFMLNDTFTVQGFYAARDLMLSKLTAAELGTLAKAFQSLPVRRQMLAFMQRQGVKDQELEVFLDDPFNQLALGYQLYAAGELKLEESPSKVMKGLNTFAHKILGTLKTSEQAVQIMEALSDARIEGRQSRLHREAKDGSHLGRGEYALSSADLTALYDILEHKGLFKAATLKRADEQSVRALLDADPDFALLPNAVLQRITRDIKAGVFTEKFTSEMAQLSDFTLNPDEQFAVQKIVGNAKLQKAARAIAAAIQFLGPVGRLVAGEAMRARFTGNAAIIDFMNSIMTDVTSQGRGESMISRKQRRKAEFDSEFQNVLNTLTDEQQVELMEMMHTKGAKSKDPEILAAREEIAKLTVRMRTYGVRAGMEIGDLGRGYVPLVFDPETVAKRAEDLIEDWMRPRYKAGWDALARERGKIKPSESLTEAQRQQMIVQTVNAIATENNGLVDTGALDDTNSTEMPPRVNAMNKRDLAFIEDNADTASAELFASVRSKDLNGTYAVYISQLVKRAEYVRTFGQKGEKFKRVVSRARSLGASQDDIELMNNLANSALGRIGLEVAPFWKAVFKPIEAAFQKPLLNNDGKPFKTAEAASKAKKEQGVKGRVIEASQGGGYIVDRAITNDPVRFRQAMSWIVTYQNFRILAMAAFTNTADLAGLLFRTGSVSQAWAGYKAGMSEVVASVQGRKLPRKEQAAQMSELRKLAQDLGIIEFGVVSDILGQMYGNNHLSGTAKKWNDKFFRWNGMEYLTRTTRLAALAAGRSYLSSNARQAAEGDAQAIQALAELDLDVTDITVENGELKLLSQAEVNSVLDPMGLTSADFQTEVLSQQKFEALPEGKEKRRQRELRRLARDERVKRGLARMVDETVLRPSATQRATWMNNPNWQVFSHLKGFLYTYQERVLRRAYTQAGQGNYGPTMQMMSYVGMIMAMDLLREMVQHGPGGDERKEEWTFADRLGDGFRRSGVAGVGTFFMDMQQASQFGSSMFFEAAGPTVSQIGQLQRAFISGRANKGTAIKRSIPGSQLAIDAPVNYMDYFFDSTLDLSLSDPRTVQTLSDSPIASRDLQREARALLFRQ